jgi:hypothetical protein
MKTSLINNLTFDKVAKTITFNGLVSVDLTRLLRIVNVTRGNTLYHYSLPGTGGTAATNVITLTGVDTNTSSYDNGDLLMAEYATGNYAETVRASAILTATTQSGTIDNYGAKGATFFINVTAIDGTPSITVQVQARDSISGNWKDIPGAVTGAITAVGQTTLTLYPGIAETANTEVSVPLPQKYRLVYTLTSVTSITFSVSALYIP